ncbi:NAD(P)-dependent oxidoreductase [Pararhodobacter sp.]|uniref:NAD(P)-dependent oxidoreductase n=1 Tax=Pararhodobacter sp. TaxID=2127056 RepID=UPI002FDCAFB1
MAEYRIGFIGLGNMGAPMARRLAQGGHALSLLDTNADITAALCAELGAQRLTADNASSLDVLITMLPNSDIVEAVLMTDAWAERLPAGATIIDMSSSSPTRSRALAATLARMDLGYLDAPVSGGVPKAVAGTLAILVGGEAALLERWRPVLTSMGGSILHVGHAGAGHAAKALNNYVSAAGLMATVEALHIAESFEIAPEVMTSVLNASSGQTNTSVNKVAQYMLSGTFGSGFSIGLMAKDLGIAQDLASSLSYPMAFGRHGIDLWRSIASQAEPTTDHTAMYQLLNRGT